VAWGVAGIQLHIEDKFLQRWSTHNPYIFSANGSVP